METRFQGVCKTCGGDGVVYRYISQDEWHEEKCPECQGHETIEGYSRYGDFES